MVTFYLSMLSIVNQWCFNVYEYVKTFDNNNIMWGIPIELKWSQSIAQLQEIITVNL